MLGKVRQGEELNEIKLRKFLFRKGLINQQDQSLGIEQFTNGYSNLTYRISSENLSYVLRMPPKGAVAKGHDMSREFRVLNGLYPDYKIAPRPFLYCDDEGIIGSSFYLMEEVKGIILSYKEAKSRNLDPGKYKKIASVWLDSLVALHKVDYHSIGLEQLGRPEQYVDRQVNTWIKQYLKAKTTEVPKVEFVMSWMSDNQPEQYYHALIHNDFKYDNVVFEDDSWNKILAILDWEMCTLGDPLMDLGTSLAYWTMDSDHPMMKAGLMSPTVFNGNPGRREIVNMYASMTEISAENIVFYYVYGLFKLAVIVQQIYFRYNSGLTNDERFANFDQSAAFLIFLASMAIEKNDIENLI